MNIEEIAKISGVSRSTVSRVINNDARVRAENLVRGTQGSDPPAWVSNPTPWLAAWLAGKSHILGLVIRLESCPFC